MIIELINTGNELLLGRVLNTHQQWICRQLADRGYTVSRQLAVADTPAEIQQAVRESLSRADLVITTGGLGPTSDDLTRDAIAHLLGRTLHEDATIIAHIESFFTRRNRPMPDRIRTQAQVPEGAQVLPNLNGTAPGLAMEIAPGFFRSNPQPGWLIMLPGPPRELRPMFTESVVPLLKRVLPPVKNFICRTFRTTGLGESLVQEKIEQPMQPLIEAGLEIGYCARPGQVDVRLVARGAEAEKMLTQGEAILRMKLSGQIYGAEDEAIEAVIVKALKARGQTLALAESCTGGGLADRLTNVPGASAVLIGGFVTYSNEMKEQALGVSAAALAQHGAVSEPVAREMAEGARRTCRSDYAIAVTGIAGPDGGTPEKPVGTVFIALTSARGTAVFKMSNPYDRQTFKEVTEQQALNFLRLELAGA